MNNGTWQRPTGAAEPALAAGSGEAKGLCVGGPLARPPPLPTLQTEVGGGYFELSCCCLVLLRAIEKRPSSVCSGWDGWGIVLAPQLSARVCRKSPKQISSWTELLLLIYFHLLILLWGAGSFDQKLKVFLKQTSELIRSFVDPVDVDLVNHG